MTDQTNIDPQAPATASANSGSVFQVPVVKARSTIEVDAGRIPDAYYHAALAAGLKTIVNGGTTKIVAAAYKTEEEFHAAAMEKAAERVQQMYENKLTIRGPAGVKTKASGEYPAKVVTEARRLAKAAVKQAMKDKKIRISSVAASDITAAANAMLNDPDVGPGYYAMAERNLQEQGKLEAASISKIDIPKADPAKVAALDAAKKAPAPLSAKQAGMTH